MFVNRVTSSGNPVCVCGMAILPHEALSPDSDQRGTLVSGSKGLVLLHLACLDRLTRLAEMGVEW
jgi:hypothetical protein